MRHGAFALLLLAAGLAGAADLPDGLSRFNPAGLGVEWAYEGTAFRAYPEGEAGTVPVVRLRHPARGHRLEASPQAREAAAREGFVPEGIAFAARPEGSVPVYRFRNAEGSYTLATRREPPAAGWALDGTAFRTEEGAPLEVARYRNARTGQELFTAGRESPYQVGAYYFGTFTPDSKAIIDGSERVYGRRNDWWGGVSDFYGKQSGVAADRRGWSGEFAHLKPAIGYYDQRDVQTLEQHIRQASDAGLSFFSFYWYWSARRGGETLPDALQSFLKARNSRGFRFNLSLYAHPWDADMAIDPASSGAVIAKLVDYFADPRYLRLPDGRPVFVIGDYRNIRAVDGVACTDAPCAVKGVDDFVAALKRRTREKLGVDAFVEFQAAGPAWNTVRADAYTCLLPPQTVEAGSPYPRLEPGVFAPFTNTGKPVSPCMMVNFDERPRQDIVTRDRSKIRFYEGKSDALLRRNLAMARQFADDTFARTGSPSARIVYLYAWNEWHEGGILEPNAATGAHDLNIVTDVFQLPRKPSRCLEAGECRLPR